MSKQFANDKQRTQFSDGPWYFGAVGKNFLDDEISGEIIGADGFPIADVTQRAIHPDYKSMAEHWSRMPGVTYKDRTPDEIGANIRLISKAPDLYFVCKKLIDLESIKGVDVIDDIKDILMAIDQTK